MGKNCGESPHPYGKGEGAKGAFQRARQQARYRLRVGGCAPAVNALAGYTFSSPSQGTARHPVQTPYERLGFVHQAITGPTSACSTRLVWLPTLACVRGVCGLLMRPGGIHGLASRCSCRMLSAITRALGVSPSALNSSSSVSCACLMSASVIPFSFNLFISVVLNCLYISMFL